MSILVLNTGSATCKWKIFDDAARKVLHEGLEEEPNGLAQALQKIKAISKKNTITAIGHRVVHGGTRFQKPTLITPKILRKLKKISALAPLHNPHNLAGITACQKLFPGIPNIAVFDTAFHGTIPDAAKFYAIPKMWQKKFGVQRYGFHGTSHEYVSQKAIAELKKKGKPWQRLITCHLGNGCSITAIKNGKSVDTSMGFTPLEGLIMGTRSGDLDPGIIFHLAKKRVKIQEIEKKLLHESGLTALAGTNDMRTIWSRVKKGNPEAQKTLTAFIYRICKYIGAYTMILGGLDGLVFTGGMGVPAFYIRDEIIKITKKITPNAQMLVIPTDEEQVIAEITSAF